MDCQVALAPTDHATDRKILSRPPTSGSDTGIGWLLTETKQDQAEAEVLRSARCRTSMEQAATPMNEPTNLCGLETDMLSFHIRTSFTILLYTVLSMTA